MLNPYMLINLKNITENFFTLKRAAESKMFCCVVKADAYRHGAAEVANALEPFCDMFAVATVDEAASLRLGGIRKDILLLSPVYNEAEASRALSYKVIFTVSNYSCLGAVNGAAKAANTLVKAHIKLNTGMNRYGFSPSDVIDGRLLRAINGAALFAEGVYSHFYNTADIASVKRQYALFVDLALRVEEGLNRPLIKHIAATGGIAAGGTACSLDMARCGLGLYGYSPVKSDLPLKPAMRCFAPMAEKRKFEFGAAGYGKEYMGDKKDMATVRFGYADGLAFSDNLCMDSFVSADCSETNGYVKVLSNADEEAARYGVSVYRILCSFSGRVERKYVYE